MGYLIDSTQAFELKTYSTGAMFFGNIGGIFTDVDQIECTYLISKNPVANFGGKKRFYIWINLTTNVRAVGAPGDGLCSLRFPDITFSSTYTYMESFIAIPINLNFNVLHQSAIYNGGTDEVDFIVHSTTNAINLNLNFSIQALIESYT
jgi:hypothetical protein